MCSGTNYTDNIFNIYMIVTKCTRNCVMLCLANHIIQNVLQHVIVTSSRSDV